MKNSILIVFALFLLAVPASAQTYLTTTTLSQAVTSQTQRQWVVASASGIVAGAQLFVDRELVTVVSVSGTTITVNRSQAPSTHAVSAVVIICPLAALSTAFVQNSGAPRPGSVASLSAIPYLPIVDTDTGNVWLPRFLTAGSPSRVWAATNVVMLNGQTSLLTTLQ